MIEGPTRRDVLQTVGCVSVSTVGSGRFSTVHAKGGNVRWKFHTGGNIDHFGLTVVDGPIGSEVSNLYGVDAGVLGSSEKSGVMLVTPGHRGQSHLVKTYQGQVDTTIQAPESSGDPEPTGVNDDPTPTVGQDDDSPGIPVLNPFGNSGSSLGLGLLGLVGGAGGYALYRRVTNEDPGQPASSRRGQQAEQPRRESPQESQHPRQRTPQQASHQHPRNDRPAGEPPDRGSPDHTQSWSRQDDTEESDVGRHQDDAPTYQ